MATNFLWAAGTNGYIGTAPQSVTASTTASSTILSMSSSVTAPKGTFIGGAGLPTPEFLATTTTSATTAILSYTTAGQVTVETVTFQGFPVLIGGESTALLNGANTTSVYWNGTGVFRQAVEFAEALFGSIFFMAGGAFTPSAGGSIAGWFLPSFDGGTTYEAAISSSSTTIAAVSRSPDFIISLDNALYAAGNVRWAAGRVVQPPPEAECKVIVQNNAGVPLPTTWMIALGPATFQY